MKLSPLHLLNGQTPRSKNEHSSALVILLQCVELWKSFETSAAGCILKEGPLQLRPRIKTSKVIQDAHAHLYFVHKHDGYFHFLRPLPTNAIPLPHNICAMHHNIGTVVPRHTLFRVGCLHPRMVSLPTVGGKHHVCCLHSDTEVSLGIVSHCFWHTVKCSDASGSALPSSL